MLFFERDSRVHMFFARQLFLRMHSILSYMAGNPYIRQLQKAGGFRGLS